jgi:uncharacterized membrane protein
MTGITDVRAGDLGPVEADPPVERFVLWPHRSLTTCGMIAILALLSTAAAALLLQAPALARLPVAAGAAVAIGGLAAAFWCNKRAGRRTETVEVRPDVVRISRVWPGGTSDSYDFATAWVRVELVDTYHTASTLRLSERGRSLRIGEFLSPAERTELATAMRRAIASARGTRGV